MTRSANQIHRHMRSHLFTLQVSHAEATELMVHSESQIAEVRSFLEAYTPLSEPYNNAGDDDDDGAAPAQTPAPPLDGAEATTVPPEAVLAVGAAAAEAGGRVPVVTVKDTFQVRTQGVQSGRAARGWLSQCAIATHATLPTYPPLHCRRSCALSWCDWRPSWPPPRSPSSR